MPGQCQSQTGVRKPLHISYKHCNNSYSFLKDKKMSIESRIKPTIKVNFVNSKSKIEPLRQDRKLTGTGVYMNEHLTKKNANIARQAHILWKQNKIQTT